jgi:hypothetical protein
MRPYILPNPLHTLHYCFGDYAHLPAGFIIFAQLALHCLFIILIFPILAMVRTFTLTQTASDCKHHQLNCLSEFSVPQSGVFSFLSLCLLLLNPSLCMFNSVSCAIGFSINIVHDPFTFLFIESKLDF